MTDRIRFDAGSQELEEATSAPRFLIGDKNSSNRSDASQGCVALAEGCEALTPSVKPTKEAE